MWQDPKNHEKYPHGYYYWKDKILAEEWAEWAAPQMAQHMYGLNNHLLLITNSLIQVIIILTKRLPDPSAHFVVFS